MGEHRVRRWAALIALSLVGIACAPPPTLTPQQQIDEIISFVETARGHTFVTPPTVTFLTESAFRQDIVDAVSTAQPSVEAAEPTFKALGWIAPGASLWAKYQIAYRGAVVGYYDPASKVLKVRGTGLSPYRRQVIAHELTHALDDQLFGLDDDFGDGLLGQQTFSSVVAIEGSARRIEQRYFNAMSAVDRAQDTVEQLSAGSDPALLTVPIALLTFIQAPYDAGLRLVSGVGAGGTAAVDAMFSRYPATSEEAFDTAVYLADQPVAVVAPPPAEGPVVASGGWGQFLLSEILEQGAALNINAATRGWAGDSYVSWGSGASSCFRLDTRMDTQSQADTLRVALGGWAAKHPGAAAVAQGPATVRLTSCA